MKTSLEDINPFRKFAMVLSRFNLLLPRLKAPCGASYPRKFLPNLMGNFSLTADSDSIIFCGIASSRSVIGSGNSCHPLNQSDNKPRTKRAWPLVFSRASGSLPVLTLKSDWLLVTFPFILLCFHFDVSQLYFDFSNCYQLSVQKPKQKLSPLTTNQNKCYHHYCPVRTESLKRGETRVIKVGLVFVLHLTDWNDGASFLDQSKSKVKQNWCNSGTKCRLVDEKVEKWSQAVWRQQSLHERIGCRELRKVPAL